jgi:hypothetical protein
MYEDNDDIIDFIVKNHVDIISEIRRELGHYDLVKEIVQNGNTNDSLYFFEYIVALYQAIIIEWSSVDPVRVTNFLTRETVVQRFGPRMLFSSYWELGKWN